MSDKKDKDTVRTKIFAVVSVVMGVIASIIITLNAYIDLVFDCRRSLIVSLILASLYVFLGIHSGKFAEDPRNGYQFR